MPSIAPPTTTTVHQCAVADPPLLTAPARARSMWRTARARRMHLRAGRLWQRGRHSPALDLAQRSLALLETAAGPTSAGADDRVRVLSTLGQFAAELGQHAEAQRWSAEAVAMLRRMPADPRRDAWLSAALVGQGNQHRLAGHFGQARRILEEARDLADEVGLDPVTRAGPRNALGILAKDTGRYADAAGCYAEVRALLEPAVGSDSPTLASLHHNLAGLAHAQGLFGQAEAPARRALELRRRAVPADEAGLAGDACVLGAVLTGQGRHDEAEPLLRWALEKWQSRYGPCHYEVAVTLHNLAAVAHARGDAVAAQDTLLRALNIKEQILGPGHPEVSQLRRRTGALHTTADR